jgi:hypothetical protein
MTTISIPEDARVLSLDIATVTGYAVGRKSSGMELSGTWDIAPRRGESQGFRYIKLRARLNEMLSAYPDIGVVVYEQTMARAFGGGRVNMAHVEYSSGCAAIVQAWCVDHKIEHAAVYAATIKKHACGKGNAKKPDMMAAARARGWKFVDDNECDAMWLLDYALNGGLLS